jgi:hypothetical protein
MFHGRMMGQTVPFVKDNVSRDTLRAAWHDGRMAISPTHARFQAEFRKRIRAARLAAGYKKPEDIAALLGIEKEAYKKYETRSMMPHHLMPLFATLVGRNINYLMTGSDGNAIAEIEPKESFPTKEPGSAQKDVLDAR